MSDLKTNKENKIAKTSASKNVQAIRAELNEIKGIEALMAHALSNIDKWAVKIATKKQACLSKLKTAVNIAIDEGGNVDVDSEGGTQTVTVDGNQVSGDQTDADAGATDNQDMGGDAIGDNGAPQHKPADTGAGGFGEMKKEFSKLTASINELVKNLQPKK